MVFVGATFCDRFVAVLKVRLAVLVPVHLAGQEFLTSGVLDKESWHFHRSGRRRAKALAVTVALRAARCAAPAGNSEFQHRCGALLLNALLTQPWRPVLMRANKAPTSS
jgi:hypothetical protein